MSAWILDKSIDIAITNLHVESGQHYGALAQDGGGSSVSTFRRTTWLEKRSFSLLPNRTDRYRKRAVVARHCYPSHKNAGHVAGFSVDCGIWGRNQGCQGGLCPPQRVVAKSREEQGRNRCVYRVQPRSKRSIFIDYPATKSRGKMGLLSVECFKGSLQNFEIIDIDCKSANICSGVLFKFSYTSFLYHTHICTWGTGKTVQNLGVSLRKTSMFSLPSHCPKTVSGVDSARCRPFVDDTAGDFFSEEKIPTMRNIGL